MQFRFERFTLDTGTRQLLLEHDPVHLSPKAFDLLGALIENRPLALGKHDLHERLWPGTFVSDTSLSTLINEIRTALGDSARGARLVRTVHRYGYAFCGTAESTTPGREAGAPTSWIRWAERDLPLVDGLNVIGREIGCAVRIDRPEVSRRHASIVVTGVNASIEDLGSRNGTFVGEEAVSAPRTLRDGDEIRLGTVAVTFHRAAWGATTEEVPTRRRF